MSGDTLATGVVLSDGPRTNTSLSGMPGFNPAVAAALMLLPDEAIVELQKIRHIFWTRITARQKIEAAGFPIEDTDYYRRKIAALDMAIDALGGISGSGVHRAMSDPLIPIAAPSHDFASETRNRRGK